MNMLANKMVSRAEPDGYTLLYGSIDITMAPSLRKDAESYDAATDLTPVAMVANTAGVFVVNPNLPVHSLEELAEYAKTNPGKVRNAMNGYGGSLHLTTKLFELKTGADITSVPYKGTSEAMLSIISGETNFGVFSLSMGASNKDLVRVLAQTGLVRHSLLPDVPTTTESGMPDVGVTFWFSIFAPPKTPPQIVAQLADSLKATLEERDVKDRFLSLGASVDFMPPAEFSKVVVDEEKKWGQLIPAMGFKPE